jgi:hypothetical protein
MRVPVLAALLMLLMLLAASLAYAQDEDPAAIPFSIDTKPADFCKSVDHALLDGYYDELDATAKISRTLTHRLRGGTPELELFYRGLAQIECVGNNVCAEDPDFDRRQERLKEWHDAEPASLFPVVALMRFWQVAAWNARGCGFAKDVTPTKWKAFGERLTIAMGYARQIKAEDDPEAMRLMIELARDFNVPRTQVDQIFDAARKRYPSYFAIYTEYGNLVQQKWSGRTDLALPYLRSLMRDPGGDTGEVAYSFAATLLMYATEGDAVYNDTTGLDWPTVRRAFATRERLYGLGPWEWTNLCYLAWAAGDRDAARDAFQHVIGQMTYWPKGGLGAFYLKVLPWIMAMDAGPTDGPSHLR